MDRKTAYLHIGANGTGELGIQAALFEHADLLEASGFLVPVAGRANKKSTHHRNLAFDLLKNRNFNPQLGGLKELDEELAHTNATHVVLSSPFLTSAIQRLNLLEKLRSCLLSNGYRIHWVFYLRTYEEWLENLYADRLISQGSPLSCPDWVRENQKQKLADPAALYGPLFTLGDTVSLRSYSLAQGDTGRDFLQLLGLPAPDAMTTASGHSILAVRLYQMLARFAELHLDPQQAEDMRARAQNAAKFLPESPTFRGLDATTAATIRSATLASHASLLQLAHIDTPVDEFFPPLPPIPTHSTDESSEALLYQTFTRCALG